MMHLLSSLSLCGLIALTAVLNPLATNAYQISVKQTPGQLRFGMIEENSTYAKAGLQRNDIIREINGKKVDDTTPITDVEKVVVMGGRLKIERGGKIINMKLKAMPKNIIIDPAAPKSP